MYPNNGGLPFGAGHASAGVTAPALEWFLAEGATGDFFDLFVLIANPNAETRQPLGDLPAAERHRSSTQAYQVGRQAAASPSTSTRRAAALANTAVSTIVRSTNGVPVIVERAMWWPGPLSATTGGARAHSSPGSTATAARWALAEGEQDGARQRRDLPPHRQHGHDGRARRGSRSSSRTAAPRRRRWPSAPRAAAPCASPPAFPDAAGRRFGAIVESIAGPTALVVRTGDVHVGRRRHLGRRHQRPRHADRPRPVRAPIGRRSR